MSATACNPVGTVIGSSLTEEEGVAVGAFLAGYSGNTRVSYATDLRIFSSWCHDSGIGLFSVRRSHLELFGRWMEENGRMRSTVARRLSTLVSFYRYCEQEGLIERNPALNVRRPRVDYESRTLGLDRNELGAFLVQAGLGSPRDAALASVLALNGLRISEALNADVDDLDFEQGHRTLKIVRKGGKHVTVPLAPRTSRVLDLYVGERASGLCSLAPVADGWRPLATPTLAPPCARAALPRPPRHLRGGRFCRRSSPLNQTSSEAGRYRAVITPGPAGYRAVSK